MKKTAPKRKSVLAVLKTRNIYSFYLLFFLLGICTLFYYFGELVDFAGWESLRWSFLYTVHDTHRLLFLIPILYAALVFGTKATIIVTIIAVMAMLPRALFISQYPDPLARMLLFIAIAGVIGYLVARTNSESRKCRTLEVMLRNEMNKLAGILEIMEDGVIIVGPDYRIRYLNPSMVRHFGEGVSANCYKYLLNLDKPCTQTCRLPGVLNGAVERWIYNLPDGKTYEVVASPFTDHDGVVCQLATFRDITQRRNAPHKIANDNAGCAS